MASDMPMDLKSVAQGAPLSVGASDINKAVYQLILHNCSDEIASIQHVQAALESALNDVILTDHTRANLQDMHQYSADKVGALDTRPGRQRVQGPHSRRQRAGRNSGIPSKPCVHCFHQRRPKLFRSS